MPQPNPDGSVIVRWEAPPPKRQTGFATLGATTHRNQFWDAVADLLMTRPGEWALIFDGTNNPGYATLIKRGRIATFRPGGSFDATQRGPAGNQSLWVRYVGKDREYA